MKRLKNFADYYIVSIKFPFGAEKEVNKCVISVIKKVGMRN